MQGLWTGPVEVGRTGKIETRQAGWFREADL